MREVPAPVRISSKYKGLKGVLDMSAEIDNGEGLANKPPFIGRKAQMFLLRRLRGWKRWEPIAE
jgi:hypothetical protein